MRVSAAAVAAALCLLAAAVQAAGVQLIEVPAGSGGPALAGAVWSPCAAQTQEVTLGRVTVPGVKDCPIVGDKLPLVVISHGRRGSFRGHHDTAEALADAGFIVAAISHPGDNSSDESQTDDLSVMIERPRDILRLIDFMLDVWPAAAKIDRARIGFFGFSRGGYAGFVVAGANPDFAAGLRAVCPPVSTTPKCAPLRDGKLPDQPVVHDPRIKAVVIADPAFAAFLTRGGLKNVTVPVQLWRSEHGGDGVAPAALEPLRHRLPRRPEEHIVLNSRHFSFLAPCSPEQRKAAPLACSDPPRFDRVAFHKQFNAAVLAFLDKHLRTGDSR
jgi:predicted dienelactone hydrolase